MIFHCLYCTMTVSKANIASNNYVESLKLHNSTSRQSICWCYLQLASRGICKPDLERLEEGKDLTAWSKSRGCSLGRRDTGKVSAGPHRCAGALSHDLGCTCVCSGYLSRQPLDWCTMLQLGKYPEKFESDIPSSYSSDAPSNSEKAIPNCIANFRVQGLNEKVNERLVHTDLWTLAGYHCQPRAGLPLICSTWRLGGVWMHYSVPTIPKSRSLTGGWRVAAVVGQEWRGWGQARQSMPKNPSQGEGREQWGEPHVSRGYQHFCWLNTQNTNSSRILPISKGWLQRIKLMCEALLVWGFVQLHWSYGYEANPAPGISWGIQCLTQGDRCKQTTQF